MCGEQKEETSTLRGQPQLLVSASNTFGLVMIGVSTLSAETAGARLSLLGQEDRQALGQGLK